MRARVPRVTRLSRFFRPWLECGHSDARRTPRPCIVRVNREVAIARACHYSCRALSCSAVEPAWIFEQLPCMVTSRFFSLFFPLGFTRAVFSVEIRVKCRVLTSHLWWHWSNVFSRPPFFRCWTRRPKYSLSRCGGCSYTRPRRKRWASANEFLEKRVLAYPHPLLFENGTG